MQPSTIRTGFVVTALIAIAAACGGTGTPTAPTGSSGPGSTNSGGVAGEILVSGSSTVEPVSQAVSEDFRALNPNFGFTVEGPGTGDGFALFCEGTSDVSDASRAIRDSEAELCTTNGVEYTELKIAYDGMAVLTHPETPIDCLTYADLYALFGPESDNVNTWQAAQPLAAELGSTTQFPDLALQITAPGEESGTYDSFLELALAGTAEDREQEAFLRVPGPNYTASGNDNVIVEGIEAGAGSLGFVGFAFYEEAGDQVKAIAIDEAGDGTCVAPTAETVADGSYPLSRPLFIYPNNAKAEANAALSAWVDFYLSDEGIANVAEVGYVALPEAELEMSRQAWQGR
jgi:phosphate transport system substrate-binding protein